MTKMLSLDDLDPIFDAHYTRVAFRLETLDTYWVGSDGGDVARYLRGEPEPDPERKSPWLEVLRAERAAGKRRHRVHVLRSPLSPYLLYECEWGYVPNVAAGEEVRILDLAETARPAGIVDHDFWLLDDEVAVRMIYDDEGRFIGAELANDVDVYRRARAYAEAAAEDFTSWWSRHPQYRRDNWAA